MTCENEKSSKKIFRGFFINLFLLSQMDTVHRTAPIQGKGTTFSDIYSAIVLRKIVFNSHILREHSNIL